MTSTLVVGFGVSGRAAARRLVARGDTVVVVDDRPAVGAAEEAGAIGVELVVAPDAHRTGRLVAAADLAVVSPGVPVGHPLLVAAAAAGVPVISEVELGARLLGDRGDDAPRLVAITGTNGKTSVTTLVRDALLASGVDAVAAGNIGVPLVDAVDGPGDGVVVVEVSSFQLQLTERFRPGVSCWLNLSPDHLDWHPTYEHYRDAKARIWANQGPGDTVVVNADDAVVVAAAARRPAGSRLVTFSTGPDADWCQRDDVLVGPTGPLLAATDLARSLPHDRANALAAAAVATAAGATPDGIRAALRRSAPLPHRVALVAASGGVTWYDDSKATTPASVIAAVAGFDSVVLIAGGRNKGLDLAELAATAPPVRHVVAIGEASASVAAAFAGRVPVECAGSMAEAVTVAAVAARPGDAVVLSPGATSFDWYRGYAERGEHFAALVAQMISEKERPRC
jgi:UDP-N-acetylmuramoylalanine--D-glutamate ligase